MTKRIFTHQDSLRAINGVCGNKIRREEAFAAAKIYRTGPEDDRDTGQVLEEIAENIFTPDVVERLNEENGYVETAEFYAHGLTQAWLNAVETAEKIRLAAEDSDGDLTSEELDTVKDIIVDAAKTGKSPDDTVEQLLDTVVTPEFVARNNAAFGIEQTATQYARELVIAFVNAAQSALNAREKAKAEAQSLSPTQWH